MNKQTDIANALQKITFDERGLVPAIAQSVSTHEVLMMAWMNREAIEATLKTGQVHYWSRSRGALWRKGETSGHTQTLKQFYVDCDGDTVLLKVEQVGPACHTGNKTCFFKKI
jgi:phosphoribosyl-AMP cyclohydrolase